MRRYMIRALAPPVSGFSSSLHALIDDPPTMICDAEEGWACDGCGLGVDDNVRNTGARCINCGRRRP